MRSLAGSGGLRAAALRLLAQREHSRAELQRKLAQWLQRQARRQAADGADPADDTAPAPARALEQRADRARGGQPDLDASAAIDAVLDELQRRGLLSDARVAQQWLASRAPRHGERRLRHDLGAKGLAPELIALTLDQARQTELPRAHALWQRRFGAPPGDAAAHARQVRFLAARGFTMATIATLMKQVRRAAAGGGDGDDAAWPEPADPDAD